MRNVVIGAGMAGLFAARAIEDVTGEIPHIIAPALPRQMTPSSYDGVHVLHDKCSLPNIDSVCVTNYVVIPFAKNISPLQSMSAWERKEANAAYGDKVYGSRFVDTSIVRMPYIIEGYDYIAAHNWLRRRYLSSIKLLPAIDESGLWRLADKYDYVVCTAPRNTIAPSWVKHPFTLAWAVHRPPIGLDESGLSENFVVYSPDETQEWSRAARINGVWYTEYVTLPRYHIPDLQKIYKVRDGESWQVPENVLLAGRYGEWKAGRLASDVYWNVGHWIGEVEDD
jgi:hypothetical protein